MIEVLPKLYVNKPKEKERYRFSNSSTPLKQSTTALPASSPAASYMKGSQPTPPPPPPPPPKESFARRYKFFVPLVLTVNLAVVAYMYMRTKKNDDSLEEEKATDVPSTQVSSPTVTAAPATVKPISSSPTILEPLKPREPIPEDKQRELYKWMLEEKRKVKPKDPEEKKCIDEEKAILKQFIRGKSLPRI